MSGTDCRARTGGSLASRPPLDPAQWERAVEIFENLVEEPPDMRERLLASVVGNDKDLAATVRAMLASDEGSENILDGGIENVAHLVDADSAGAHELKPGDTVGDFEIIAELGRGGMGVVYSARDRKLGRVAALKLLPVRSSLDADASRRLIAEAQVASALDHPNVATIYQIGETVDGRHFIAMARYEGETLRERLQRGPLKPREAFSIARQVASGLASAHSAGLVHRDVKPENIFLTRQGLVKLLDFGIATLAGSPHDGPATRGTVIYTSPEHARRQHPDARADVWSLGVVLYEMIAGAPPFTGRTAPEVLSQISDPSPVRLPPRVRGLPSSALAAITHSLEKDRDRRFANAGEFAAALDRADRAWTRPRQIRIAAGIVAALAIVAVFVYRPLPTDNRPAPLPSLAVLPIAGDSSSRDDIELASALSDEIAARAVGLGRVKLVRITRDSSGAVVRNPGLHLLHIETRREAGSAIVSIALEKADDRSIVWSDRRTFDRAELRELGRDVVIGILGAMGQQMSDRERAAIGSGFPSNAEAYEEFLRANRLLAVRTPASVEGALIRYRHATTLDTAFAGAYARQSYAYSLLADWGWKPTQEFAGDPLEEGLALADRATRLDSTSAEAWLSRAYILVRRDPVRFTGAVEAFQHAIALDPYNAEAFHQYGQTLMPLGRYAEALAAYRRTLDLEPERAMTLVPMAAISKRLGRVNEALRLLDTAIARAPRVPYARASRALTRAQVGDLEGAREDAEYGIALDSTFQMPSLTALVRALWLAGDTARAIDRLDKAEQLMANPSAPTPTEAFWLGMAEVSANRTGKAVELLRRARPRGALLWFMFEAAELESFRKIPEVASIMSEIAPVRQ